MSLPLVRWLALGPLEVRRGDQAIDLGAAKQRAVLAVLLAATPEAVSVERLCDEVWPSGGPRDPVRNLQVYVSALRQALSGEHGGDQAADTILTVGRAYRLGVSPDAFDVERFLALAQGTQDLLREGQPDRALESADAGLALWRGDAWQDVRDVPVIEPLAHRLDSVRVDVLARRAEALLALGRHRDLVADLEPLVAAHPLREDLRGHLMLALHRSGRQSEALASYAAGRATLVAETGLEPGAVLQDLHAAVLRDDPILRIEDADVRARRHLPAPATGLVGRAEEVATVIERLRSGARIVTLTGPGGVGKTRISVQAAHEYATLCPDGVWFVDLASITEPRLVPQAMGEALGVDAIGDEPAVAVTTHLAQRSSLLVLDNFEQVDSAAGFVASLVADCPHLQVLVTSRTRLRVYGEHVQTVTPLPTDDAVVLFVERARAVDHRFQASSVELVRRLCAALDNLPLAIELVAARVGDLTLEELSTRLEERLDLATDGPRERSDRQRALRASIDWSVQLLGVEERRAFRRLAVFGGGFQAAAAEEVCGISRERLTALVRASLVVRDDTRFAQLETIREHALDQLASDPDNDDLRDRHATYHLALAEQTRVGMAAAEAVLLIGRLKEERANVRAALEHFERAGHHVELLRLATALTVFWYRTSPASPDVDWVEKALRLAPRADPHLRARAFYGLGICRGEQGRTEDSVSLIEQSHALFMESGDDHWTARALNSLSGVLRDLGRAAESVPLMEESIELRRRLASPDLPMSIALDNRALVAIDLGDHATAHRCLAQSRALATDERDLATMDLILADLALEEGDVDVARGLLREAVPAVRRHDLGYRLIESLDTLAFLAVHLERLDDAAMLVAAADRALAEDGATQVPADAALRQRRVGTALAALDPATRARAAELGSALPLDEAVDLALDRLVGAPSVDGSGRG
jgi:predicted ATPase/DNA-binding SARP family transcriptional activator